MGYFVRDAVVAVTSDYSNIGRGNSTAMVEEFRAAMPEQYRKYLVGPVPSINGDDFWCFLPDGSKEGWDYSNAVEEWRTRFVTMLSKGYPTEYVAVSFGGDLEYGAQITADSLQRNGEGRDGDE